MMVNRLRNFFATLPTRLARVTSGGKMITEIDGLRFLAIAPVVVQHLSERLERKSPVAFIPGMERDFAAFMTDRGSVGVYLFFVISGFILGMPFAAHFLAGARKVNIKNYFWRRLTRLEPPYLVVITMIALYLFITGANALNDLLPHYLATITYTHSLIYKNWSYINPPVWTLEIEVQFYILAPLLAMGFFRVSSVVKRRVVMLGSILTIMLVQQYFGLLTGHPSFTILAHIHYFLMGFVMADVYLTEWKDGVKRQEIYNYIGIIAFVAMFFTWSWSFHIANRFLFLFSLFALVYAVFRSTWFNRWVTSPWITAIGGMCYTIYLIHLPIIEALYPLTKSVWFTNYFAPNLLLQLLILGPVILFFSIVFYLVIEKPCMNKDWPSHLRNRLIRKKSDHLRPIT
jgi:peptidoglycan/LPS O-acetylase OafA/YrhL